jgi:hypothetical protein
MQRIRAVLLFSALVPACVAEDDEPPSVVGKPLEEQIDVIEDVLCAHTARCGIAEVVCDDCDGSDCGGCTVTMTTMTYEECRAEIDYADDVCTPVTGEQADLLDNCLQAIADFPCPDLDELEAWANGEADGPSPELAPASCDVADEIVQDCDEGPSDGGVMPAPG